MARLQPRYYWAMMATSMELPAGVPSVVESFSR